MKYFWDRKKKTYNFLVLLYLVIMSIEVNFDIFGLI